MENAKTKIAIVVVVAIVVAAGCLLAQSMSRDNGNGGDNGDNGETTGSLVQFLVQDNYGVYFWIEGTGATVYDAFKDAAADFSIPFVPSADDNGTEYGVTSMFGLEMAQDAQGNWSWWSQYNYATGAWTSNESFMCNMDAADYSAIAMVYGDGSVAPAAVPADAKVWNGSTAGTVFTVESPSGIYFKVNGEGTTVLDAFKDATADYAMPFEVSSHNGVETGIQSLYGMSMAQDANGNWSWWVQFNVENGAWAESNLGMNSLNSADVPSFLVMYGTMGAAPSAPVA